MLFAAQTYCRSRISTMAAEVSTSSLQVQAALQQLSRLQWQVMKRDLNIVQVTRAAYLAALSTPSQTNECLLYLRSVLAAEDQDEEGVPLSIPNTPLSAVTVPIILSDLLQHDNARLNIFNMLTTRVANRVRVASEACRAAVALHPWHDDNSVVTDVALWRKCFPQAVSLYVSGEYGPSWNLRGAALRTIGSLRKLRLYCIHNCTGRSLKYASLLVELRIGNCSNINTADLAALSHLRKLHVSSCANLNKNLDLLPGVTELTHDGLDDEAIGHLPASIEALRIGNAASITEAGLVQLERYPKLASLTMARCMQAEGEFLLDLSALTSLVLEQCSPTMYKHALHCFLDRPTVFIGLCTHLWQSTQVGPLGWTRFIEHGGAALLIAAMRKHIHITELVQNVCKGWAQLTQSLPIAIAESQGGFSVELLALLLSTSQTYYSNGSVKAADAVRAFITVLIQRPSAFVGSNDATQQIIAVMRAYQRDVSICQSCFVALKHSGMPIPGRDAVHVLVDTLRTHVTDRSITFHACALLRRVCSVLELRTELAKDEDVVPLLIKAVRVHMHNGTAFLSAFEVLYHLARPSDSAIALPIVALSMEVEFPSGSALVESACDVMLKLCTTHADALIISSFGGTLALVRALDGSREEVAMVTKICQVLTRLALHEAGHPHPRSHRTVALLLDAINTHSKIPDNVGKVHRLCGCIVDLAADPNAKAELISSGVILSLTAALSAHKGRSPRTMINAIQAMAQGDPAAQAEFGRLGVVTSLLQIFDIKTLWWEDMICVLQALDCLLDAPGNQAILAPHPGVLALIAAMCVSWGGDSLVRLLVSVAEKVTSKPANLQTFVAHGGLSRIIDTLKAPVTRTKFVVWACRILADVAADVTMRSAVLAAGALPALERAATVHADDADTMATIKLALDCLCLSF